MSEQTSKLIVITGATAGIGLESALQLAAQGHRLVLVGRNPAKLAIAAERALRAGAPTADPLVGDFESLASVRALAAELRAGFPAIDVLVNNAGTVYDKRSVTVDGFESTFAVDHLAPFLLTELVKDLVVAAGPGSRIVFTASTGHYGATMDFDDLGFERGYTVMRAYGRAKLANVLYARSLAAELEPRGVTVNSLHPGAVATDIWSGAPWFAKPVLSVAKLFMRSPADGGRTLTFLATDPAVEGLTGGYYDNDTLKEPSAIAQDDAVAARLREVSAQLVGVPAAG